LEPTAYIYLLGDTKLEAPRGNRYAPARGMLVWWWWWSWN